MKPEFGQEIWYVGDFDSGKYLEKMKVAYVGEDDFVCHEQANMPIAFASYGVLWFLTKEEALEAISEWRGKRNRERKAFRDMIRRIFAKKEE